MDSVIEKNINPRYHISQVQPQRPELMLIKYESII